MTEMLRDAPRLGWRAVAASWARTGALAACSVALGGTVDALLTSASPVALATTAAVFAALGALAGAVAEALPGRIHAAQEQQWRDRVMAAAMAGTLTTTPASPQPSGGEGIAFDAATSGVEKIGGYRATFLAPTFASFTAPLLVLTAWAVAVDTISAVLLAAFVALVPVLIVLAAKLLRTSNAEYRRRESAAASRYLELLEGLGTLKVLGAFPRVWREYSGQARNAMAELGRLLARNQTTIIVHDAVFGLLMAATAVTLLLAQLASGSISAGQAVTALLLTVLLVEPIDRVGRTFYVGLGGRARREQVEAMLDNEGTGTPDSPVTSTALAAARPDADPCAAAPSIAAHSSAPTINVRGLEVHADAPMLRGIDLSIPAGARVSIVGPSGAGKSTLLRVLAGLQAPARGEVLLDGIPARASELRAATTLLAQSAALLSATVAENLRLAAPAATDDELRDALGRAHLLDEILARPGALNATVGHAGAHLSGGQRRRLALARALLRPGRILLLDEATADLDRTTEALVRDTLRDAASDRTVVQVAHRLATTLDADLVFVLDGGRVAASGTPAALAARPGYYRDALAAEEVRA